MKTRSGLGLSDVHFPGAAGPRTRLSDLVLYSLVVLKAGSDIREIAELGKHVCKKTHWIRGSSFAS